MKQYTEEQKKIIGENIWIRRNLLGMSTKELAEACGCSAGMVNYWERGDSIPPIDRMKHLVKVLKCSRHDLHRIYHIPKLSFTEEKVVEKKEEPVMSDEDMVKAAAEVFENAYTEPVEVPGVEDVRPVEEPKEVKPEVKASISDRLGAIYNTLFNALAELDELKADIGKIEKVTTMLKEIQGL
jgi:transcriptional regulator with XRE-family HTH domain